MRWFLFPVFLLSITVVMMATPAEVQGKAEYVGYKKCARCHGNEKRSWLDTSHAKAFDLLKAGARVEAKKKAGLDPDKGYTDDEKCLPCHTTGYGERGGYKKGMGEKKAEFLRGVTCEMCHGRGSLFRQEHSAAEDLFLKKKKTTPRKVLVKAGQNFDYEGACAGCHLNYEGSSWKKAKKPYTPFTPKVDKKYVFDFDEWVRRVPQGLHEHYKLTGIFEGPPVPKIRAEFQKNAKEAFAQPHKLVSVKVASPPELDGDGGDDEWKKTKEVIVEAEDGPKITIKSVYTEEQIFFLVSWEDLDESINMDQWVYDGKKWNIKQEERIDKTWNADTDRLSFQWPIKDAALIKKFAEEGCKVLCHSPVKEDKMYTSTPGQITDIWQWMASLTNPLKYAEDWYQDHTNLLKKQEPDKVKRITAAQKGDELGPGKLNYVRNMANNRPKWMPKDGHNRPFFIRGEEVSIDMSKIEKGDTIPGWLLGRPKGSRGDINAVGKYYEDDIIWVTELSRRLVTDDKDHDIQFDDLKKTYYFGLVTWDNDRLQAHTWVRSPFMLTFK